MAPFKLISSIPVKVHKNNSNLIDKLSPNPNQTITTMKTIISSLLFFYGASAANQRLLQQAPEFNAGGNTPANPAPAPAANPEPAAPAPPAGPAIPNIVLPSLGAPSMILECNTPYNMAGTCAGSLKGFTNPVNEFKIECSALGGCAQSNFEFNYSPQYYGERIHSMIFSEAYSGYQSSITLDNQSPYNLYIDNIECKAAGACQDMKIKVIGGGVNDVSCQRNIGACTGCTIELCKREVGKIVCEPPKPCNLW